MRGSLTLTRCARVQVRVTRGKFASGTVVEAPAVLRERKWPRPATDGLKDTSEAIAQRQTHEAPTPA